MLIRVLCVGIRPTDIYVAEGRIPVREPRVLGHELWGVVDAVGIAVHSVAAGAAVAVMPLSACGACASCVRGEAAAVKRRVTIVAARYAEASSAMEMLRVHGAVVGDLLGPFYTLEDFDVHPPTAEVLRGVPDVDVLLDMMTHFPIPRGNARWYWS